MAVAWVSSTTSTPTTSTTTCTCTLPTTAANDILVVTVNNGGANAAVTMTTGTFSLDTSLALIGSGGGWATGWGGTYWVRCSGNHSGETIILTGATDSCSMLVQRFSGCITAGNPYDTNISEATVAAGANCALAAFSTTVADTLVVYAVSRDDNIAATTPTKGGVAMGNLSDSTSTGGADSGSAMASLAQAGTGTSGAFSMTFAAGTNSGKRATAFALKEPLVTAKPRPLPDRADGDRPGGDPMSPGTLRTGVVRAYGGAAAEVDPYVEEVLADSPYLYWRLGEPSGTTAEDASPNNRDGTYSGATLGVPGQFWDDTAISLDGVDDYVQAAVNPFSGSVTCEGWYYRASSIVSSGFAYFRGGNMRCTSYSNTDITFRPAAIADVTWTGVCPTDEWFHLALTYNETNAELFINGVSQGTRTPSSGWSGTGVLRLGDIPDIGFAPAKVDEFAVYSSILSSGRITAHYEAGYPFTITGLVGWWKADSLGLADGAAVTTWADSSGAAHNLTGGSPTYKTGIVNGLPVVRFDNTDDTLTNAAIIGNDASRTIFFVVKSANTTNYKRGWSLGTTHAGIWHQGGEWSISNEGAGAQAFPGFPATEICTDWHILTTRFNSTSSADLYTEASAATNYDPADMYATWGLQLYMGSRDGTGDFFGGDVAEMLIYDSALSDSDLDDVREYLADKWGL